MINIGFHINGDYSPAAIEREFGLQDHGPVQTAIDNAAIRYMIPYWAYDTGRLANSAYSASDIGSGILVYDPPYAWDMYLGVRENGKPVNYHLDKNPQAGPFPFERMMADHYDDILEEARAVATSQ